MTASGQYSELYSFGATAADGQWPEAGLAVGPDGALYGTTFFSGPRGQPALRHGLGSVFRLSTTDHAVSTIYDFQANGCTQDGSDPVATMTLGSDGNLYGVARDGGAYNKGAIFRIQPNGAEQILYSFGSIPTDCRLPAGQLLELPGGSFLGTTLNGGAYEDPSSNNLGGTVFLLTADGTYTRLADFGANATDGQMLAGGMTLGPDGNYYGTTDFGGANGWGTVFRLVLDGSGTGPTFHATPFTCPVLAAAPSGKDSSGGGIAPAGLFALIGLLLGRRAKAPYLRKW